MNFIKMTAGNYETYPKKSGQYLIKYHQGSMNYYMIAYFWAKGDKMNNWPDEEDPDKFGFFYDENCEKEANIEGPNWNLVPYEYIMLPDIIKTEK